MKDTVQLRKHTPGATSSAILTTRKLWKKTLAVFAYVHFLRVCMECVRFSVKAQLGSNERHLVVLRGFKTMNSARPKASGYCSCYML